MTSRTVVAARHGHLHGSFVIFFKGSIYNMPGHHRATIGDTYDARHDEMDAQGFRIYVEKLAADARALGI